VVVVKNGGCNTSHSKRVEQAFYTKYTGDTFFYSTGVYFIIKYNIELIFANTSIIEY
jgi:hypothetical protein